MSRTIDITDFSPITVDRLEVIKWIVDLDGEKVTAHVREIDINGVIYREFEVTFWANMPAEVDILDEFGVPTGETIPNPDTWYILPIDKITELITLSDEILIAVKTRLYV